MLLSAACLYQVAVIGVMYSPTAVDIASGGGLYQLFADVSLYLTADGYDCLRIGVNDRVWGVCGFSRVYSSESASPIALPCRYCWFGR